MKKLLWRLSICAALVCCLYAARHYILAFGLEWTIGHFTGETVAYTSRTWKGSELVYQNFSIGEGLHAEEATFNLRKITLKSPTIHLEGESKLNLAFLLPNKYWTVKLDVEGGNFTSPDGKLYMFDFVSGKTEEEIGALSVYQAEAATLFTCNFSYVTGSLAFDFQMENAPLAQTLPLVSLFYPFPAWKSLEGTASASLQATADLEEVVFVQGQCALRSVRLETNECIVDIESATTEIDFQGDIENLALDTDFKGANLFWKELEVLQAQGSIVFKPKELPTFEAHAAVHLADLEGRADLVGRGEIHAHQALWMEGTLDYVTAKNPLKIDFSLADDRRSQVLQTEIKNLGKEVLALLPFGIKQGTLDGKITTFLDQFVFERMQIDHVELHQLAIEGLSAGEIEAEGSINLLSGDIEQLTLQAHEIEGEVQGFKIVAGHASAAIQDNHFSSTSAFGKIEGIPFSLELEGPIDHFHAKAKLAAGASEWIAQPKNAGDVPLVLNLSIDRKESAYQISGLFSSPEDQIELKAEYNGAWNGEFKTNRLQLSFYGPFLKVLAPHLQLAGEMAGHGTISLDSFDLFATGQDLVIRLPEMTFSMPGTSPEISYHYDFKEKRGSGTGNLSSSLLTSPQLETEIKGGEFVFDPDCFSCLNLTAEIGGIDVLGHLTVRFDPMEASFLSQKVQGSIENLCTVASRFQKIPFDLQGRFACPPEGLQIHFVNGQFHYRFQALFKDLEGALSPSLYLDNASCTLILDAPENHLTLQNLKGTLNNLPLTSQQISYDGNWTFDAKLGESISCRGEAQGVQEGYHVTLQEGQAAGSVLKSPLSFYFSPPKKFDQVSGLVQIDAATLLQQLELLQDHNLLEINPEIKEILHHLSGTMTLRIAQQGDQAEYELQGSNVSSLFNTVDILLIRQGTDWTLKRCALDDLVMRGRASHQNEKWVIPVCNIDWKEAHVQASGLYEKNQLDFKIEGKLSHYPVKGKGSYAASALHNLSFQLEKLALLTCKKLTFVGGKMQSPAVDLTVYSTHFTEPLRSELILSGNTFQGAVSQGESKIGKSVLKIKQIFGLYEDGFLNLKCVAALDSEPLQLIGKFDSQLKGGVNIEKEGDLLQLTFAQETIQKVEGELCGVALHLQQGQGTVSIKDGHKLADLLDNDHLRTLRNVSLAGTFDKGNFKGELSVKEASIFDYQIEELSAQVEYTPTRFRLRNIAVQDPAGSLEIKECQGLYTDAWTVSIPLVKGKEIRPSAIRKIGAPSKEKPLQIRNLVMTDLIGRLDDLSSFRGKGSLNFTQRVKKEPSIFDIPLAMLKDLGLDLDLFSPVIGEASLELRGGKLFLTGLQNTFSDGKRSEFYLAEEPSYIDLNGPLSINLRMQQNVALKLAEPFMIAVRGTWEKPKYSLR